MASSVLPRLPTGTTLMSRLGFSASRPSVVGLQHFGVRSVQRPVTFQPLVIHKQSYSSVSASRPGAQRISRPTSHIALSCMGLRGMSADTVSRQEKELKAMLEAAEVLKDGNEDATEALVASLSEAATEALVAKLSERTGGGTSIGPGEHKITIQDFSSMDVNKDGVISSAEFKQFITENQRVRTEKPTQAQLQMVALASAVPFVGFGFMDNAIMILAGEVIEIKLGMAFGITTMCAAAIGNLISDVAGVGLGGTVEVIARKMGFKEPELSPEQMDMAATRLWSNLGAAIGVAIGCFLGMFPLLLIPHDHHDHHDGEDKIKQQTA